MFGWKSSQEARDVAAEYATRRDFQEIFTEDMADLQLLAFLLTADQEKSEECFVAGLEDTIAGNPVFRDWARSWSKRAIIKNAIKSIAPAVGTTANGESRSNNAWSNDPQQDALISAVTNLSPFDRFVFVMTVLEGYSPHECAALLNTSLAEIVTAKSRALQCLGSPQVAADTGRGARWMSAVAPGQTA